MKRFAGLGVWLVAVALCRGPVARRRLRRRARSAPSSTRWHGPPRPPTRRSTSRTSRPTPSSSAPTRRSAGRGTSSGSGRIPYFAKGKAWSFRAVSRWISFSPDRSVAWFDEALDTPNMGPCRGSGVLVRVGRGVEDRAVQPLDPDSQRPRRRHREADRRGRDVEERPLTMRRRMIPVLLAVLGARRPGGARRRHRPRTS